LALGLRLALKAVVAASSISKAGKEGGQSGMFDFGKKDDDPFSAGLTAEVIAIGVALATFNRGCLRTASNARFNFCAERSAFSAAAVVAAKPGAAPSS
jgi:hypothetical protein